MLDALILNGDLEPWEAVKNPTATPWATPTNEDGESKMPSKERMAAGVRDNLNAQVTAPAPWSTPDSVNRKSRRALTPSTNNGRRSGGGQSSSPGLEQQVELSAGIVPKEMQPWPTPDAATFNDGQTIEAYQARKARELEKGYNGNGGGTPLAMAVTLEETAWPTPTVQDGENDAGPSQFERNSLPLNAAVMSPWPTPHGMPDEENKRAQGPSGNELGFAVNQESRLRPWQTPTGEDAKNDGNASRADRHSPALNAEVMSSPWQTPMTSDQNGAREYDAKRGVGLNSQAEATAEIKASLNPDWVECLMNFPTGWTKPLGASMVA